MAEEKPAGPSVMGRIVDSLEVMGDLAGKGIAAVFKGLGTVLFTWPVRAVFGRKKPLLRLDLLNNEQLGNYLNSTDVPASRIAAAAAGPTPSSNWQSLAFVTLAG